MSNSVYINATSTYFPNAPVDNDNIERVLGYINNQPSRAKDLVLSSNQIKTRYYAIDPVTRKPTHTNAQLAACAVETLFNDNPDLNISSAQVLCCATTTQDLIMPGHGQMVHGYLKNFNGEVFSSSGVCCSSMSALKTAFLSLSAGDAQCALVTASETASQFMRSEFFESESTHRIEELKQNPVVAFEYDFLRWMLSDGAGAFYLSTQPIQGKTNLKINWIEGRFYANQEPVCMMAGGIKNADKTVTSWKDLRLNPTHDKSKFIMNCSQDVVQLHEKISYYTVERGLGEIKKSRGLRPGDYDWFLPHYSSNYFKDPLAQALKKIDFEIPNERWFTTLSQNGNIGSASIFAFVDKLCRSGKLKKGQKILGYIPESARFSVYYFEAEVV